MLDAPAEEVWPLLRDFAAIGSCVTPAADRCVAEWSAKFDCDEADEEKVVAQIREGVFLPGLAALRERFAR